MIVACIVGVLGGLIGMLPLLLVGRLAVKPGTIVHDQSILFGLLSVMCSMVLFVVMMLVYRQFDAEHFVGFGCAAIVTFLIAMCVVAVRGLQKRKH